MRRYALSLRCSALLASFAVGFLACAGVALASPAPERVVALDPQQSSIQWIGKKVTGQHSGTVALKSGEARLQGDKLVGGTFEIDLGSIRVSDLTDPADNAKLTNHLKSDDFFAALAFPVATFSITKAEPLTAGASSSANYRITGDLTIKGIRRELSFPAQVTIAGDKATARASFEVDRTMWNVRYGSGKFFQGLGDKLIYDNFVVTLDISGRAA